MIYLILPTAAGHTALELAIRESRDWYGLPQTGTTRYCGEPRKDASGKYPFPVVDQDAEAFIRAYNNGKYADAVLVDTVEWPQEEEE
jgi:hypothetical protein